MELWDVGDVLIIAWRSMCSVNAWTIDVEKKKPHAQFLISAHAKFHAFAANRHPRMYRFPVHHGQGQHLLHLFPVC